MNDATKAEFQRALSGLHNTLLVMLLTEDMGKGERATLLLTPSLSIHLSIFSFPLVSSYPLLSRRKGFGGLKSSVLYLSQGHLASSRQNKEPKPGFLIPWVQISSWANKWSVAWGAMGLAGFPFFPPSD